MGISLYLWLAIGKKVKIGTVANVIFFWATLSQWLKWRTTAWALDMDGKRTVHSSLSSPLVYCKVLCLEAGKSIQCTKVFGDQLDTGLCMQTSQWLEKKRSGPRKMGLIKCSMVGQKSHRSLLVHHYYKLCNTLSLFLLFFWQLVMWVLKQMNSLFR